MHCVLLASLFRGICDAQLFVLAEVERHVNVNSQVRTMLDERGKQRNKKQTVTLVFDSHDDAALRQSNTEAEN